MFMFSHFFAHVHICLIIVECCWVFLSVLKFIVCQESIIPKIPELQFDRISNGKYQNTGIANRSYVHMAKFATYQNCKLIKCQENEIPKYRNRKLIETSQNTGIAN